MESAYIYILTTADTDDGLKVSLARENMIHQGMKEGGRWVEGVLFVYQNIRAEQNGSHYISSSRSSVPASMHSGSNR